LRRYIERRRKKCCQQERGGYRKGISFRPYHLREIIPVRLALRRFDESSRNYGKRNGPRFWEARAGHFINDGYRKSVKLRLLKGALPPTGVHHHRRHRCCVHLRDRHRPGIRLPKNSRLAAGYNRHLSCPSSYPGHILPARSHLGPRMSAASPPAVGGRVADARRRSRKVIARNYCWMAKTILLTLIAALNAAS